MAKQIDTKVMIERHNSLLDEIDKYIYSALTEKRSLTASEKSKVDELRKQQVFLKGEIERAIEERRNGAVVVTEGEEIEKRGNKQMKNEIELRKQIAEEFLNGEVIEARAVDTTITQANTVPTLLYSDIVRKVLERSNIANDVPKVNGVGKMEFLVEKEEIKAKMLGETEELTDDGLVGFDKITLEDRRMATLVRVSKKLLLNSPVVGVNYVTEQVAKRISRMLEQQLFKGDGLGNNYTGGILHVFRRGEAGAIETAQQNVIDITDIKNLILELNPVMLNGSKLYMNRAMFKLVGTMQDNEGRFFLTHNVIADKPVYMILGIPVEITEEVEADTIVLGNVNEGMKMKMSGDMEVTILSEEYKRSGEIGIMCELFGDASVLSKDAFRVLRVKQ